MLNGIPWKNISLPFTVALSVLGLAAGCDPPPEDGEIAVVSQALNGALLTKSTLTRNNLTGTTSEIDRRGDTLTYYNQIGIAANGSTASGVVGIALDTLAKFNSWYGFDGSETKAFYYNRGDLGIGREMHCKSRSDGQIACYVRNYFGGDGTTEFGFGMSSNIAFDNMDANQAFATVAMVYRPNASRDKVYFVVYDGAGKIATNAALDRHGLNYALEFDRLKKERPGQVPDPAVFGTNGVNFNNHIPTNCMNCHGGIYDPVGRTGNGGLFLPFDLDQFEYQEVAGRRRADQNTAFAALNTMVRRVARGSGAQQIVDQVDGWHNNQVAQSSVLTADFVSSFVPSGWSADSTATAFYRNVMRPYCRNCHIANPPYFNTELEFQRRAGTAFLDLCNYQMPHALQTIREFWLSPTAPTAFARYYDARVSPSFGDDIRSGACGGTKDVVTLDPQFLVSTAPLP